MKRWSSLFAMFLMLGEASGNQAVESEVVRHFCKDFGYDPSLKSNAFQCGDDPNEELYSCEPADDHFICKVKK